MGAGRRSDGPRRIRAIEVGDDTAGVRLGYVKGRRMLRLGGWHSGGSEIEPLEFPASTLLSELGIAPDEFRAAPVYLLLAGLREPGASQTRRVTTAFAHELQARQTFRQLRIGDPTPTEWAELFALDIGCGLKPLCWFGNPSDLSGGRLAMDDIALAATGTPAPAGRRRWPRRAGRAGE